MYSRMEEIGYRLHFEETVTCRLPDEAEQKQLEITETLPVLILWRRCYDQHGRILDLTHRARAFLRLLRTASELIWSSTAISDGLAPS